MSLNSVTLLANRIKSQVRANSTTRRNLKFYAILMNFAAILLYCMEISSQQQKTENASDK